MGGELLHVDGRTDGQREANRRFSKYANAPKNRPQAGTTGTM
jgi:hypothetical protein